MEINKIQNIQVQQNSSQQKQTRVNLELPNDSVSFSTKQKNNQKSPTFWGRLKSAFKATKKENTNYNSVSKGFEEHFYTIKDSIVSEISLTSKQKKILDKKIKDFEEYKASLSTTQLAELEKNKHGLLDFSIKYGVPETSLKAYNNFLSRYEAFKSGDYTGITNEELAQLLYYTDTTDLISDKKIGSFAQGRTGDCWFLSMLGNYASTKDGEENIAKRISNPDANGTYTVTFDDPFNPEIKREYKVTQKDLQDYDLLQEDTYFSAGDLDVRILEVATGKMLNNYILQMDKFSIYKEMADEDEYIFAPFEQERKEYSPSTSIAEGYLEKQLLVHRSLGYKSNVVQYITKPDIMPEYHPLVDYSSQEFLDSTNAKIYSIEMTLEEKDGSFEFIPIVNVTDYQSLSDVIKQNDFKASELTVGSSDVDYSKDDKENRYISTGHVYNLMGLNQDGSLTVNDPYNSAYPHTISNQDFERVFNKITHISTK